MADLRRLLTPKSLAVVGGGVWCASVITQAKRLGFQGKIIPVHPKKTTIADLPAVPSVSAIEEPVDAAFVGVNRNATLQVVASLRDIGAGGAVCFASGFLEATNEDANAADMQAELVRAAGDMPILGPNCYGFVNALDRVALWPDQHGMRPVAEGVAILTQSSNIAINLSMQARGLPIAYMVTCGNQAQTTQAQLVSAMLDDPRVTVIGLHIEGFGDTRDWWDVSEKASERGIPIVALKVGASEQAQAATLSHTASLAGSDAGARALLSHLGFAQVRDLGVFLELLKLLHVVGLLEQPTLSSISCSGGEASLIADMAEGLPLTFPALTEGQKSQLSAALGPMVALANPLDYHTYVWGDVPAMTAAWAPMAAEHIGMTISVVDYPRTDPTDWDCTVEAALAVRARSGRPFAVVASLPELMPQDIAARLMAGGVLAGNGLRDVLDAAAIAAHVPERAASAPLSAGRKREKVAMLDEASAKAVLSGYGLQVPRSATVDTPQGAASLTAPLAVKSVGLAHKSDAGGVRLGLAHSDIAAAMAQMPGETFLIEEMVTGAVAELIVGVTRDAAHGFVLTIGAGGILTELLQDTRSLLIPADRAAVAKALNSLKVATLLSGFRGKPAADMEAIIDAVMALQAYVQDHHETLEEVEINPLICTANGAVAVDALIRKEPE